MINRPLISVIVNCFNGEKYLREAIDSIYSQTYENWEIIFWDNVSTDNSAKIAKTYDKRLRYFRGDRPLKLYSARRLAVEKASGEYLAFLDVDDWWEPEKLTKQIEVMLNTNASLVYSSYFFENTIKNKRKIIKATYISSSEKAFNELTGYSVGLLTLLIRKCSYHKIGGFNDNYHLIGDHDLVLRMSNIYSVCRIDLPLGHYRWHGNNESVKNAELRIKEIETMLYEYENENVYPEDGLQNIRDGLLYTQIKSAVNKNKRILALNHLSHIKSKKISIKALSWIVLPKKIINIISA